MAIHTPEDSETANKPGKRDKHCFIVMPFGRDSSEQKWFRGWYEVVIKPAVQAAGYESKLAAAEEQPGAINDEIRTHLAFDQMVVVDLGGTAPEEEPNPNVMYELGIRHALGLPLVIMAWKGQRLPFDVSNQRVIQEDRELVDLETNRKRLVAFIHAAEQGKYYRPMDAVGRLATIQAASEALGEDSLLRVLVQEIQDMKNTIDQVSVHRDGRRRREKAPTIKKVITGKVFRKSLYPYFESIGGEGAAWARILRTTLTDEQAVEMKSWKEEDWKGYLATIWREQKYELLSGVSAQSSIELDEDLLNAVKEMLPAQPWPQGIHREIAGKLDMTPTQISKYIQALIRRGDFMDQVDGELFPDGTR